MFLSNVALAELRSRRLTRGDCERLAIPARVKVAQIWTYSSANVGRAHHQTLTVYFKEAEKKQSFKAILEPKKFLGKVQKAMLLA